jgi:hypothetical protein
MRPDRTSAVTLGAVLGGAALIAGLNLATAAANPLRVPDFAVSLVGKYLCYALLALAIDLVWGYAGILTLGHAAFFALGGYAMGMYPMREIGARGVYADPNLPDFMVFLGWKELPWYWHGFGHFWFALPMAMLAPGVLAALFGWFAFRSRVSGVYLSIITQALTYALMLAFFRNDMGFGGNNGMTDFKDVLGFPLHRESTAAALMLITATTCSRCFRPCAACCAGAAAISRAGSNSSWRSPAHGSCARGCSCWTSRPKAFSRASSRRSGGPFTCCANAATWRSCWSSSITTSRAIWCRRSR